MKEVLSNIKVTRPTKIGLVNNSAIRKQIKTENLQDAKSKFPYKVKLSDIGCTKEAAQQWLINRRMRSWKQKGVLADYYYNSWDVLWFANKDAKAEFLLCMHK